MDNKRIIFSSEAKFSLVAGSNGSPGTLSGYAMVWNQKSTDRGGYKVVLAPNSATFDPQTFALWNHNYDSPLARADNGTLSIVNDTFGAKVAIELANTTAGKDVAEMVRTGLVRGMSFGMVIDDALQFTTATDKDGDEVDTFSAFNCDEVTCTPIPAFPQTSIGVAGPSPFARAFQEREKFSLATKEFNAEVAKLELYRHQLYSLDLAEIGNSG